MVDVVVVDVVVVVVVVDVVDSVVDVVDSVVDVVDSVVDVVDSVVDVVDSVVEVVDSVVDVVDSVVEVVDSVVDVVDSVVDVVDAVVVVVVDPVVVELGGMSRVSSILNCNSICLSITALRMSFTDLLILIISSMVGGTDVVCPARVPRTNWIFSASLLIICASPSSSKAIEPTRGLPLVHDLS